MIRLRIGEVNRKRMLIAITVPFREQLFRYSRQFWSKKGEIVEHAGTSELF